ncbi:hypothetical protein D3C78_930890 [compost metagenome]
MGNLLGGTAHHQFEVLLANAGGHDGRHVIEHLFHAEWHPLKLEPARLNLGKIEDVVDDPEQRLSGLVDLAYQSMLTIVEPSLLEQVGQPHDGVHGGTDLVAHVGNEIPFDLRQPGRLLLRQLFTTPAAYQRGHAGTEQQQQHGAGDQDAPPDVSANGQQLAARYQGGGFPDQLIVILCRVQGGPAPQPIGRLHLATRSAPERMPGLGRSVLQGEFRAVEHETPLLRWVRATQPITVLVEQHGVIRRLAAAVGERLEHTSSLHVDEQQAKIMSPKAKALGNADHGVEGAIDHPVFNVEIERRDVDSLPGQRHGVAKIITLHLVLQLLVRHTQQALALTIDAYPLHPIRGQPTHLGIVGITVHQDGELDCHGVTVIATRRLEQDGFFRYAAHMAQRHRQLVVKTAAGERQEGALIAANAVELALNQCIAQQIPPRQDQQQNR